MNANPNLKTPLAKSSLLLMLIMLGLIIASLIVAGMAFSGFLDGGRSFLGLSQAFLLCFGAGSLVYLPAAAIFAMARNVRANGPKRQLGWITALLALPVWGYGLTAILMKMPYMIAAIIAVILGLYLTFWAIVVIKHDR